MKSILVLLFMSVFSLFAWSQSVGVKVDDVEASEEGTTIEIKKGVNSNSQPAGSQVLYEITTGEEAIEGDPAPLLKDARMYWKKACTDWKKELKELNQGHQVINVSCGTRNCATQSMETVCSSKGTYKIKVRMN